MLADAQIAQRPLMESQELAKFHVLTGTLIHSMHLTQMLDLTHQQHVLKHSSLLDLDLQPLKYVQYQPHLSPAQP
jgi:hypothetical protein